MSSDDEDQLSSVEDASLASSADASLHSASENENLEPEPRRAEPHWLLSSPFLIPDDESEEGILDGGGRDGSDRYVELPGVIPRSKPSRAVQVFSVEQKAEIETEFTRLWSLWDAEEKRRFWAAVQKCGRLQPREISKRIGTKTAEQVSRILFYLEVLKLEMKPLNISTLPQAVERSATKIEAEEKKKSHTWLIPDDSEVFVVDPLKQEIDKIKSRAEYDGTDPSYMDLSMQAVSKYIGKRKLSDGAKIRFDASVRVFVRGLLRSAAYASVERSKNTRGFYEGPSDAAKMAIEDDWTRILHPADGSGLANRSSYIMINEDDIRMAVADQIGHDEAELLRSASSDHDDDDQEDGHDDGAQDSTESSSETDEATKSKKKISKVLASEAPAPAPRAKRKRESQPDAEPAADDQKPKAKRRKI